MKVGTDVVVTTKYRGVFFGKITEELADESITLEGAQMCIYWSPAMRGVFGLASIGPDKDCRIGGAVPLLKIPGITAIAPCTDEAASRWRVAPWK